MLSLKQKIILRKMRVRGIPSSIVKYTNNVFEAKVQGKYSQALMEFPKKVIIAIDKMIVEACGATGQTAEELINSTDFNPLDLPSDRIESLFAELRTVIYLYLQGFKDICFIKSDMKHKRADIKARKGELTYIIEVTCSSSFAAKDRWKENDIVSYIIKKMDGSQNKRMQLKDTLLEYKAHRIVLVVVLDTEDKNALNSSKDAMNIASQAWLRIRENNLHISIIMGRPDKVYIYPKGSLIEKILHRSGYIKGRPFWINMFNKLIEIFGTCVEEGSGDIVYPPWPN